MTMRGSIMQTAMAGKTWMKLPSVNELTNPRSQITMSVTESAATVYRSSQTPLKMAPDKTMMVVMIISLRLFARSFSTPRACQADQ